MHGVIKFALPLGHGLSDERSLTGNKGANEWWGGGRLKVLPHENKKQSVLQSRWLQEAALHPSRMLIWSGLTGILQRTSQRVCVCLRVCVLCHQMFPQGIETQTCMVASHGGSKLDREYVAQINVTANSGVASYLPQ